MAKIKTYNSHTEIPQKYKWNVSAIYKKDSDWEDEFKQTKIKLTNIDEYKGKLQHSSQNLFSCINLMHNIEQIVEKLYVYAHLKKDEDTRIPKYQEYYQKAHSLYTKYSEYTSFFLPELLKFSKTTLNNYLNKNKKLSLYKQYFENLFRFKNHTLSKKEEELFSMARELLSTPGKIFGMFDNADIKFGVIKTEQGDQVELSKGLYGKYQQHPNRELRKQSYITLYKPYIAQRNTLAENFLGQINAHIFAQRTKKFKSTLEASLFSNNIPTKVFKNLINDTNKHLKPLHDYVEVRKKMLQINEVHDYDLLAPLTSESVQEYNYEEGLELVFHALKPLGKKYINDLKMGIKSGWIDVFESKGKRSGAYSSGAYLTPPYILHNFSGTLNDVYTLAHEIGHSMHSFYTRKNNPYVYGDYSIFLAEIASTLNEGLLTQYLVSHTSSAKEKQFILNEQLDKYARTFYRQVLFAEFEWKTHGIIENGESITADSLDTIFGEIYEKYHGNAFKLDRETKAMWSRIPHFYYNYYVFQYATGIAASTALLSNIISEGEPAVERYLTFLSAGSSDYPLNILKNAGVDMSKPQTVIKTTKLVNSLLKEFKNSINLF